MKFEVFECFSKHVDFDALSRGECIFKKERFHTLYGGRSSGKSVFVAQALILEAKMSNIQVLCGREIMNSINDSVMALLWEQVEYFGLESFFTKTKTEIIGQTGARFFFRGLKTNISSIKSIARIDRVFLEESENISEDTWAVLTPSIRTKGARIIVVFNPRGLMDATYQKFVIDPPTDSIITKASYLDNPYMPEALEQERLEMKVKDPDLYEWVWEGVPIGDTPLSIIPSKWLRACIDIHKIIGLDLTGEKRMGFDVSSSGPDENCVVTLDGQVVTRVTEFRQGDPTSAAYDAWELALQDDVRRFTYDSIGVGAGVGQTLSESNFNNTASKGLGDNGVEITGFNAGGAVMEPTQIHSGNTKDNGTTYLNVKAQTWGGMRYKAQQAWLARNDMPYDIESIISFSSDHIASDTIEKMIFELSTPMREYVGSKLKVESKEKLLRRGVKSHNIADALLMADHKEELSSLTSALASRRSKRNR